MAQIGLLLFSFRLCQDLLTTAVAGHTAIFAVPLPVDALALLVAPSILKFLLKPSLKAYPDLEATATWVVSPTMPVASMVASVALIVTPTVSVVWMVASVAWIVKPIVPILSMVISIPSWGSNYSYPWSIVI